MSTELTTPIKIEIPGIGTIESADLYLKAEADKVIAELKEVYKDSVDVKVKIWERCKKVEDELRKHQRALWLARYERAHVTTLLWNVYCYQNNCLYFRDFMNVKCNPFRNLPKKTAMEWSDLWESIETKCLAKVDKYK